MQRGSGHHLQTSLSEQGRSHPSVSVYECRIPLYSRDIAAISCALFHSLFVSYFGTAFCRCSVVARTCQHAAAIALNPSSRNTTAEEGIGDYLSKREARMYRFVQASFNSQRIPGDGLIVFGQKISQIYQPPGRMRRNSQTEAAIVLTVTSSNKTYASILLLEWHVEERRAAKEPETGSFCVPLLPNCSFHQVLVEGYFALFLHVTEFCPIKNPEQLLLTWMTSSLYAAKFIFSNSQEYDLELLPPSQQFSLPPTTLLSFN